MKKILSKMLIIIGLSIILITNYLTYSVKKTNNDIVKQYENSISNEYIKKETKKEVEKEEIPKDIIGILEIPKIDIKVAIQEGTDEETLKYAVGHFKETVMPGEVGNFSVAGHRNYTYNKFFSNLDKVSIGDEIEVTNEEGKYTYKVSSSDIVTPDKVEVLNSKDNEKLITLITCTPKYSGTHRLVIKGELK